MNSQDKMTKNFRYEPIRTKLAIWCLFLVLLAVIFGSKIWAPEIYYYFITEDSLSEYAQAGFYLMASLITALFVRCCVPHKLYFLAALYALLSLGLFFVGMEEISWGQRVLDIANPEYFRKNNVQRELTIHNLNTFQPVLRYCYMGIGLYGAISWVVIAPLLFVTKAKGSSFLHYVAPPWYLAPYFFVCFVIYTFLHVIRPKYYISEIGLKIDEVYWKFLHWREEEHAELFLSLGFLLFALLSYRKLKRYLADRQLFSTEQ
jgi:hypothetical protein